VVVVGEVIVDVVVFVVADVVVDVAVDVTVEVAVEVAVLVIVVVGAGKVLVDEDDVVLNVLALDQSVVPADNEAALPPTTISSRLSAEF